MWKSHVQSADSLPYIIKLSNVLNHDGMYSAKSEVKILNHLGKTDFSSVLYRVVDNMEIQEVLYHAIILENSGISLDYLPLAEFKKLQTAAVASLQKLHGRGVIHGDIRLPNFVCNLIGGEDVVRIIDFGESYMMDINSSQFLKLCEEEIDELLQIFINL